VAALPAARFLFLSPLNWIHSIGAQAFEKLPCAVAIEGRIAGFDAEKKAIAAGKLELFDVENRMIGHGQAVEREHAKKCR
jgi:hypothetical protein